MIGPVPPALPVPGRADATLPDEEASGLRAGAVDLTWGLAAAMSRASSAYTAQDGV